MKKYLIIALGLLVLVGCGTKKENAASGDTTDSSEKKEAIVFNPSDFNTNTPFDSFVREPDSYKGTKTTFVAKVFQAVDAEKDDDLIQYMVTVTPEPQKKITVMLVIEKGNLKEKIIEDDEIRVWVQSLGEFSYETTNGTKNTVPTFNIHNYEIIH